MINTSLNSSSSADTTTVTATATGAAAAAASSTAPLPQPAAAAAAALPASAQHNIITNKKGPGILLRTLKKGDGNRFPQKGDMCLVRTQERKVVVKELAWLH